MCHERRRHSQFYLAALTAVDYVVAVVVPSSSTNSLRPSCLLRLPSIVIDVRKKAMNVATAVMDYLDQIMLVKSSEMITHLNM